MIPKMTYDQTQYFLRRLYMLMPKTAIAEELGVNAVTLQRWEFQGNMPKLDKLRDFQDLLKDKCKELHRMNKGKSTAFYSRVADALLEDPEPKWVEPARPTDNLLLLRDTLIELCYRKGNVKSTDIFRVTDKLGYTRTQVYYQADKLGIVRTHTKMGRGGHSIWTMSRKKKEARR